ncbi:MAG: hypothetical protein Q8R79_03055 [Legionellaceae bacterium]|nr:hypothetical protein [Legionellaceae bacterium]
MIISLQNTPETSVTLTVSERLPIHIDAPYTVECQYTLQEQARHFLMTLALSSQLLIRCQRCMQCFEHHYQHRFTLALCLQQADVDKLSNEYEAILLENKTNVNLEDLINDEIHLYSPEKHDYDCFSGVSV